ncbi:MAG: DUF3943 domain-containing protein [Deltaproteobacteria bacterium]|nr:DUF3943 domain-containing protein [Deltaproteobacteria bacterium]
MSRALAILLLLAAAPALAGSGDRVVPVTDPAPITAPAKDAEPPPETSHPRLRIPLVIVENALVIVPPTIYYWNTPGNQSEDWELHWDWPSWRTKLTSLDVLVLDTNKFEANGIRHPLVGALTYQIGRANGLGPIGATVMNLATSVFWEYVVEFKERPALNDLITNTAGGILIGEPLFQLGLLGDSRGAAFGRHAITALVSPFHHVQRELKLSPAHDPAPPPNRLTATIGADVVSHDGDPVVGELRFGLDLEMMRDRNFGQPGAAAYRSRFGNWNRIALDLRVGDGLPGARFASSTTYLGRTARAIDDDGNGRETFIGLAGGFEYAHRDLNRGRDKVSVLSVVGPRFGAWWWSGDRALAWDIEATGDLAMVQAQAFAVAPLEAADSVLRLRGYYYATGVSTRSRLRAEVGRWSGALEASAYQFWSFDRHSYGGDTDPHAVADQRATLAANAGVDLPGLRLQLVGDATVRRGTWQAIERVTTELSGGVALMARF